MAYPVASNKIERDRSYARIYESKNGFRRGQIVEILDMNPDKNQAIFRTSTGRVSPPVSTDIAMPESIKFVLRSDYMNPGVVFRKGDIVVCFEDEPDGTGFTEVFDFKGRGMRVPDGHLG